MEANLIPCYNSSDVVVNWQDDNFIVLTVYMVDDIDGKTYLFCQKLDKRDFVKQGD